MIIVMKENATEQEVRKVQEFIEQGRMKPVLLHGTSLKVFAAIGETRSVDLDHVNAMPGVDRAIRILTPYKLAGILPRERATTVHLNGCDLGSNRIGIIAGPCTVESEDQIIGIAERVKAAGAIALRGGAFKPRSSPYAFQGLHIKGLEYLALARARTGLAVVTEVMAPDMVNLVAQYADVLQIGARNMQNYALLEAVGTTTKPVILKRGMSATMEEFLLAAEYILARGNPHVILCERGIRTFEDHTRFTLPLATVPFLKEHSHLPVVVDPSHGTGKRSFVAAMCRAAVAAGADGLLIEVHTDPEGSVVDAAQTISCDEFQSIMEQVRKVAEAVGRTV
ncbi:MAG: 3-deoxy-7-phosphoheptulonate synthase [Planctomycetota bacterium]